MRYTHLELVTDKELAFNDDVDAVRLFQSTRMHKSPQEIFWALGYGGRLNVATMFEVNRGQYAYVDLHIPSLMGGLLLAGCERFVLAHNHPSNDPSPSQGDIEITKSVMKAANTLALQFEDHMILVPDGRFFSLYRKGILSHDPDSPYAQRAAQKVR